MRHKVTTLKDKVLKHDFSIIILKNTDLLESIKDYFYQNFIATKISKKYIISIDDIDQTLKNIDTKYALVVQEGMFFDLHVDNDFLRNMINDDGSISASLTGHILDRKERYYQLHQQNFILNVDDWKHSGSPSFFKKQNEQLTIVKRSEENFHDDYTPLWIEKTGIGNQSYERLKFGGYVISEMLKSNFEVKQFTKEQRQVKKFVYHTVDEQVKHLLSYDNLHPYSFYYPMTTRKSKNQKAFSEPATTYFSVANAVESLYKIKDIYKDIKTINFYDISITALIFTEMFIKDFNGNYAEFVKRFDRMGARKWTTIDPHNQDYGELVNYNDVDTVTDVLKHIRNNVKVNYYFGDITRLSIIERIDAPSVMYVSNSFDYKFSNLRNDEYDYWSSKVKSYKNIKQVLS